LRKISQVTQNKIAMLSPELQAIFDEIFRASNENDTVDIANAFNIPATGTYTATRTLNVTAPTLANVVAVLATLLEDLQRGGTNRNT
jgi:hypothetical protein